LWIILNYYFYIFLIKIIYGKKQWQVGFSRYLQGTDRSIYDYCEHPWQLEFCLSSTSARKMARMYSDRSCIPVFSFHSRCLDVVFF